MQEFDYPMWEFIIQTLRHEFGLAGEKEYIWNSLKEFGTHNPTRREATGGCPAEIFRFINRGAGPTLTQCLREHFNKPEIAGRGYLRILEGINDDDYSGPPNLSEVEVVKGKSTTPLFFSATPVGSVAVRGARQWVAL